MSNNCFNKIVKKIVMNNKRIILVTGATGAQGGSVAKALLAQNKFRVRILTRNTRSEKALALKDAGAEIIEGNLDNKHSLLEAARDCYGVFGVTNFWEHYEAEYEQGKNLLEAVQISNIKHLVFHSLPHYGKLSGGKFAVAHCDIKATLKQYAKELKLPATFVQLAFYYENFFSFFPLQKQENGKLAFGFPQGDTKLAMVSVEDLGPVVAAIFDHPKEYIGRTVGVVGADNTCREYAKQMSEVLEKPVEYHYVPRDVYAGYGFPGAEELANMFEVQRLHIPGRQLDLIESYGLNPGMQSFKSWLIKNKGRFNDMLSSQENKAAA
jgi:uncharacterized protein YbjT (DUF2867 family)